MHDYNTFEVGHEVRVYLTYADARDIQEQENIDGSPLIMREEEFPVVCSGHFDSTGTWLFYATHSETTDYDLKYKQFIEAVKETQTKEHTD